MNRFLLCSAWLLLLGAPLKGWAMLPGGRSGPEGAPAPARITAAAVVRSSQRRIDSLQALIAARPRLDSVKVILVTQLASEVQQRDVRASLPYRWQALRMSRELNYRDFEAEVMLDKADCHILLGEYAEANRWLRQAQQEFTQLHNEGGQVRCLERLARIAAQQGQYVRALSYCFQVPPSAEKGDVRRFYINLQIQVARIYRQLGELATAESYLQPALRTSLEQDYPDRLNLIYGELGEVYRQQRRWSTARHYYARSMAISEQLHLASEILSMEINLAEMDEELGHAAQALARVRPALEQARRLLPLAEPRVLALLARSHLHAGRLDSAAQYARRSLQASRRLQSQPGIQQASEILARAYARQGQFASAYKAQQLFMAASDSLSGAEVRRRTAALRYNQQLSQQKAKIQLLTQQARLQQQQQELSRLRQQRQVALIAGLSLLALALAAGSVWWYRRRQKAREAAREAALRTSLAADLHDDVGSLLTQISLQSTMLREGLYPPEQQRNHLDHMAETSRMAARQMSDVVWGIDARNDSFSSVLDRMRDHAHRVLPPAGLELDFVVDPALTTGPMPLSTRQALYLIYKEALHNAVKHAEATQVTVRLQQQGRQVELYVHDDGRGPAHPTTSLGQGLRNMQARATAAGGALHYQTEGPGFGVTARLPLG